MSVYVGLSLYPFGRMMMAHMIADSVEELHRMADSIGVSRRHFQDKRIPHYDICKSKRRIAVDLGAIEADELTIVKAGRNSYEQRDRRTP